MLPVVQAGDKPFMDYGDIIAKKNKLDLYSLQKLSTRTKRIFLGFAGINQFKNNQRMSSYSLLNKLRMFYFIQHKVLLTLVISRVSWDNFKGFISSFVKKRIHYIL